MIDIDKCMNWWKNHRAEYKCNMGNRDGTDAEEELINTLYAEVKRLREAIADVATNMDAADASYMGGFIEDLRKVIEDVDISN